MGRNELLPEDEDRLERIDNMLTRMLEVIDGDSYHGKVGLNDVVRGHEGRITVLESIAKNAKMIALTFIIGVGFGGLIFGVFTLKQLMGLIGK